ncbi:hypothetical protein C8R46DRAFT_1295219 [Mycena filopes]|nr:hypothetical protein C8R46DRAFT_1295219 [Mycena filopes]
MTAEPETIATYNIGSLDPTGLGWTMVATRTKEHSDADPVALPTFLSTKTSNGTIFSLASDQLKAEFEYDAESDIYRYGQGCGDIGLGGRMKWTLADDTEKFQWLSYELDANGQAVGLPLAKLSASIPSQTSKGLLKASLYDGKAASSERLAAVVIATAAHLAIESRPVAEYTMPLIDDGSGGHRVLLTRTGDNNSSEPNSLPDMLTVRKGTEDTLGVDYDSTKGGTISNGRSLNFQVLQEGEEEQQYTYGKRHFRLAVETSGEQADVVLREMKGVDAELEDENEPLDTTLSVFPGILQLGQLASVKGEPADATAKSRAIAVIAAAVKMMVSVKSDVSPDHGSPEPVEATEVAGGAIATVTDAARE